MVFQEESNVIPEDGLHAIYTDITKHYYVVRLRR